MDNERGTGVVDIVERESCRKGVDDIVERESWGKGVEDIVERDMKSLIIIRLDYYLTSLLTKIATVTRTSQATAPQSTGLPYKSVRRLICAYLQGPQFLSLEPKPRLI